MNKLILFCVFILGIVYYTNKYYKSTHNFDHFTNTNVMIDNYYDVMNNPNNLLYYKKLSMAKNNDLKCLENIFNILKRRSKFISIHHSDSKSKPVIGIFSASTSQLSKIMDGMHLVQQDFLDSKLPNGVVLFYLLVNKKMGSQSLAHFSELISTVIANYKRTNRVDYILYPIENYFYKDPVVKTLLSLGFQKINIHYNNVVFFKKYL